MNENKNKPFGWYLGRFLAGLILTCIVACLGATCLTLTAKLLFWLWGL